jgi:outer membrane protein OmpA-like peptidoglycan-associated protein
MVEVRSYMDKNGSELDQLRVTEAWATTVRKYLITLGVPGNQVLARGMGSRDPVAPNTTAGNRAQNRRVEVHRLN